MEVYLICMILGRQILQNVLEYAVAFSVNRGFPFSYTYFYSSNMQYAWHFLRKTEFLSNYTVRI